MPNLFPDSENTDTYKTVGKTTLINGSYAFDFNKGEFIKNPDGSIKKCNALESYQQWCQKVMNTKIGLISYSSLYGHELNTLSGMSYSKEAIELEVKRMTIEAIAVHPMTKEVKDFIFTWKDNGELYYEYTVVTIDQDTLSLNNSIMVG